MTVRAIQAGGKEWRYAPDVPPPTGAERSQVILQARLVDEVLGSPPSLPIAVTTTVRDAVARLTDGGRVGVIGRPALIYFEGSIANGPADLKISALGFLPLELDTTLGPQPGYPDNFTPRDLGLVALHRSPVRLAGRVVSRSTGPLIGATVTISAVWPVLQHPPGPPDPPNAMPLFAGLYRDRPIGTMRRRNFLPAAQVKRLERPATGGNTTLRLSDSIGIAPTQVLAIDYEDTGRLEYININAIDPGSTPDQPALVTLDHALRRDHAEGTLVARALPSGGAGPANPIGRAARRGDTTLWTSSLSGIGPATTTIEISGGPPAEYQPTTPYSTTSGSDGSFSLAPIHRVAIAQLTVAHASQPAPIVRAVALTWNAATQIEDFIFP